MSEFITGKKLSNAIYDIIWEAEETLLIVSPYVKLDKYFKGLFGNHENNPKLHIILIFGKNETEVSKSLSKSDFDFFKKFLNISIIYVPNLHAKYYGNEKKGVVTSINLYDYSFDNNIEFGVYTEQSIFSPLSNNLDTTAWNTCIQLSEENDVVFIKRPMYENKKFIINLTKNFIKSETLHDSTEYFYGFRAKSESKRLNDFPEELEFGVTYNSRPKREKKEEKKPNYISKNEKPKHGYCIRTGEQIAFNPSSPLSYHAWQTWSQFSNFDFPEKFCHKTGQLSYGKTSMRNPILEKNPHHEH